MNNPSPQSSQELPTAIGERDLRRGMRINILAGSSGMMWAAVAGGMPLTMFMESIKASGVLIGMTATVQQFAMLLQVPTAFVSEMLPARKWYWGLTALAHRAIWLIPPFLPFLLARDFTAMAYTMVVLLAVSSVFAQASTAAWWSWMSDLIPERLSASFWGTRQSITMCAYLLAMILSGYVLDLFPDPGKPGGSFSGFSLVFGVAGLLGCLDILIHFGVPEPKRQPIRFDFHFLRRIVAPLREADFRMLTLSMSAWSFALWIVAQFGFLCLKREYDINYTYMSLTAISSSLGVIAAGVLWPYVMDRIGARNFGVIMMILAPTCGLAWFFLRPGMVDLYLPFKGTTSVPQAIAVLLVVNAIGGAFYSGVGLAQISLLGVLSPPQGRTMAMAVHWAVLGAMTAAGPLVGGAVMDGFTRHPLNWQLPTGSRFNFYHACILLQMLICYAVAVPLLLRVKRRAGEMAFRTALSRFIILNPVRMASSIYNVYTMGVSDSRLERASAVRKLGEDKLALAVADMIAQLDDPSLEVREEAAMALGSIGSPDAVDALLAKLQEPDCDLVPEITRALRVAKARRAAPVLRAKLGGVDRETTCEIVRTLGEIGDRDVAPDLIGLLRETNDTKVLAACSEALAHLGEFTAVYDILPRMKSTRNATLNRALTVALGDLLGERGGFYRVLSHERRTRGSETEPLLATVTQALVHVAGKAVERDKAAALVKLLDNAYMDGHAEDAVRLMVEVGQLITRVEFGVACPPGQTAFLIENLVCRDERFGVGIWFLGLLKDAIGKPPPEAPDDTDVLLGIYFLAAWARRYL